MPLRRQAIVLVLAASAAGVAAAEGVPGLDWAPCPPAAEGALPSAPPGAQPFVSVPAPVPMGYPPFGAGPGQLRAFGDRPQFVQCAYRDAGRQPGGEARQL